MVHATAQLPLRCSRCGEFGREVVVGSGRSFAGRLAARSGPDPGPSRARVRYGAGVLHQCTRPRDAEEGRGSAALCVRDRLKAADQLGRLVWAGHRAATAEHLLAAKGAKYR
jgi:hypothetical protein